MFEKIIFCLCFIYVDNTIILPIKKTWVFSDVISGRDSVIIDVPFGIFSDLKTYGSITNIFDRINIYNSYNIKNRWKYTGEFRVFDEKIRDSSYIELIFHGIDGTATIYLNNAQIGTVSNTFIRYRFDVTQLLKFNGALNIVRILFDFPIEKASELSNMYQNYISTRQRSELTEKNVHFLRRMQASFGTEWAPTLPSYGVWKPVELAGYFENDLIIRDIVVSTSTVEISSTQVWRVDIVAICEIPNKLLHFPPDSTGTETVSQNIGNIETIFWIDYIKQIKSSKPVIITQDLKGHDSIEINLSLDVPKELVKLWWPNGYGSQTVYDMSTTFTNANGKSKKYFKIGFRTIKLIRDNIEENNFEKEASYFYFVVNDIPIFAKGANIFPVSILPEESSNEKIINNLLKSVKEVHMNMLRVPAIGIYQSDYFYEKCDEYGILVWQDIMLDKEMYLFEDEEFIQSLTIEMKQQYQRLQHHPSIALWAGNSEIPETIKNTKDEIIQEKWANEYSTFVNIFIDIFGDDKLRPYVTSTPSNKFINDPKNLDITEDQNDFFSGDVHIKSISDSWVINEVASVPRFATEYGIWSLPSIKLLQFQTEHEITDVVSVRTEYMKFRQRRDNGDAYAEITDSVIRHFGVPIDNHLDAFIYASQINQAWSMKLQTEHYRRWRNDISQEKTGKTMGALFWHLNDVWATPSASSIEFNGKWKMLHYYARKFFSPVGSSIESCSNEKIKIHLFSDLQENIILNLKFEIFKWSKLKPIFTAFAKSITLEKLSTLEYKDIDVMNLLKSHCKKTKWSTTCIFKLTIYKESNQEKLNTNYFLPATTSLRQLKSLPNPNVRAELLSCIDERCNIRIHTDAIALFVWLDMVNVPGYFSDNGFIMTESQKDILFYRVEGTHMIIISDSLKIEAVISRNYLSENFLEYERKSFFKNIKEKSKDVLSHFKHD